MEDSVTNMKAFLCAHGMQCCRYSIQERAALARFGSEYEGYSDSSIGSSDVVSG